MYILSDKLVKTRKQHVCFACGRLFEKGTEMNRQVNTFDGINAIYTCETCTMLFHEFKDCFIDEIELSFQEGCVHETFHEFNVKTPEELLQQLTKQNNE